ncbi:MAG: potassium transporter Kup [Alphaproteobacteria bacterium]
MIGAQSGGASAKNRTPGLVLAALGVVYGDVGTSPLYAIHECFGPSSGLLPVPADVFGILSLIFWSLLVVVSFKYVSIVMRADNGGEGGILALLALAQRAMGEESNRKNGRSRNTLLMLGLFGAALFYGDAMITPAISVLSAVEGLEEATPLLKPYVLPVTIAVLMGLFLFQKVGSERVGRLFGPVMVLWFSSLGLLGLRQIIDHPSVLRALDPRYAFDFMLHHGWIGFVALGSVVLVLTGAEALYADMGHFGRRPIRLAWYFLVLPSLLLNYFGQGALILTEPEAISHPFYRLAPDWGLYPLIGLATLAAVIASQAVISGAFSLSHQAVQLGFSPRLEVAHTSHEEMGQIYIPRINWGLLLAVVCLVLGFKSSSNLAAAYGIAVTGTMIITTMLAYVVIRGLWDWNGIAAGLVVGFLLVVDMAFLGANMVKIPEGGWFSLAMGVAVFVLMTTWKRGRAILFERLRQFSLPLDDFLVRVHEQAPARVAGTAVFMTGNSAGVPYAMLHNLKHNRVLHERVVLLTVLTVPVPVVDEAERLEVSTLVRNFYRVVIRYGFMESPNVPEILGRCGSHGLVFDIMETSFFLGRESLVPAIHPGMALWRERLFIWMSRNAISATDFFKIPSNRVVELGTQVEL